MYIEPDHQDFNHVAAKWLSIINDAMSRDLARLSKVSTTANKKALSKTSALATNLDADVEPKVSTESTKNIVSKANHFDKHQGEKSMGGLGSGCKVPSKATINDRLALNIRQIKRLGLLSPGKVFNWQWTMVPSAPRTIQIQVEDGHVVLSEPYQAEDGTWQAREYRVALARTRLNTGGLNDWFCCPVQTCGRRVATLYGGTVFACRHCHKLNYPSQRESRQDRVLRKAEKIRAKLGWQPGILNRAGGKPLRMRWASYLKLCAQHDKLVSIATANLLQHFEQMSQRLNERKARCT